MIRIKNNLSLFFSEGPITPQGTGFLAVQSVAGTKVSLAQFRYYTLLYDAASEYVMKYMIHKIIVFNKG